MSSSFKHLKGGAQRRAGDGNWRGGRKKIDSDREAKKRFIRNTI